MIIDCERCKKTTPCIFYGRPSDVDNDEAQNGEWLCEDCVPKRVIELDDAIEKLKRSLKD